MNGQDYDFIIVGAGSAGCVLANRLSARSGSRVCVVEGGGSERSPLVQVPAGILALYGNPRYDYAFVGTPQPEMNGRRLPVNRGKALGGSSSINSMVFIRGACSDYDEWAALGCAGWAWDDVLPVFKGLERNLIGQSPDWHGFDGELFVDRPRDPNPVSRIFTQAGRAVGLPENADFNAGTQEGLGIYDVTQNRGMRWSSYRAFLRPVENRPNLTVRAGVETRRLTVEGGRVTGIEIATEAGVERLRAREVILAAGAIGSPAILMRSGIGPAEALAATGVTPAHDLPGVGQNLRDHIDGMITVRSRSTTTLGLSAPNLPAMIAAPFRYAFARKGMLTTNYVEAGGFARTKFAGAEPDIQFHFVPGYRSHRGRLIEYGHGYAVHTCVLRPRSVGELRLARDGGLQIDHRFFTDPRDAATLVEGIKVARAILADPGFAAIRGAEMLPGPDVRTDDEILAYLRAEALTVYHPVGTCKMGTDPMAVCDPATLRLHGLAGLRVADASVMPTLIGGNTNVPSMMIGERCAEMALAV